MSKVSFRTRQIDFNRSLPIVRYDSDLFFELGEGAFVNRGAPAVPSGMEREEENEHHFIEVLQALQMQKNANVSIPVPEIIDKSEEYEKIYSATFSLPRNLIHIRTLEDEESVEYDMDSDDEEWLRRSGLNLSSEDRRVFQLRYKIEDWEAAQLSEADAVAQKTPRSFERLFALSTRKHLTSRKRKISGRSLENALVDSSDTSDAEGSQARNDPISFIRLSGCKYQRPSDCRCFPEAIREEMFCLSRIDRVCHNSRHTQTGYLRRRFGRGGRTHFDRVQSSEDVDSYLHRLDSLPSPPETQTLQLQRFDRSGGLVPCNGSPADFISNEPPGTPTHPSLSPTNENVLFKRFQFYLRSLSKHRLAFSLSRLTGGRCISSGWFGSSGNSIYSRSISDTVYKISVSPSSNSLPPSDAGSSLVGKPASTTVAVKSVLAMRGKNHHQCRRGVDTALTDPLCPVVTSPSDGGDGAAVCGKGRVAPIDSSATVSTFLVNVRLLLLCLSCLYTNTAS
uniref:Enhancer of polycomb-like protein n=1 Tax=Echinococcus granulosus TaxID=6210 RepID=A0A068W7R9_ECHGR|nr:enhancer of polycomb [Echinococcus granulosus]